MSNLEEACGNEVCRHRAKFYIENAGAEEVACANHLAWAVRKVQDKGGTDPTVHDYSGAA